MSLPFFQIQAPNNTRNIALTSPGFAPNAPFNPGAFFVSPGQEAGNVGAFTAQVAAIGQAPAASILVAPSANLGLPPSAIAESGAVQTFAHPLVGADGIPQPRQEHNGEEAPLKVGSKEFQASMAEFQAGLGQARTLLATGDLQSAEHALASIYSHAGPAQPLTVAQYATPNPLAERSFVAPPAAGPELLTLLENSMLVTISSLSPMTPPRKSGVKPGSRGIQAAREQAPAMDAEARARADQGLIESALRLGEPRLRGFLPPRSPTAAFFVRFIRERGIPVLFDESMPANEFGGYLAGRIRLSAELRAASPEARLTVIVHEAFHAWVEAMFEADQRLRGGSQVPDRWIQFEEAPRGLETRVWTELHGTPGLDLIGENNQRTFFGLMLEGALSTMSGIWLDRNTLPSLKTNPLYSKMPDLRGYSRLWENPNYSPAVLIRLEQEADESWRAKLDSAKKLRWLTLAGAAASGVWAYLNSPASLGVLFAIGAAVFLTGIIAPSGLRLLDLWNLRRGRRSWARGENMYRRFLGPPLFTAALLVAYATASAYVLYAGLALAAVRAALALWTPFSAGKANFRIHRSLTPSSPP